jgi:hypothetical protein
MTAQGEVANAIDPKIYPKIHERRVYLAAEGRYDKHTKA